MAYVSANLNLMAETVGGTHRWWSYIAGADAQTAIRVNNFFSDGFAKGCKQGDLVIATYASGAMSIHQIAVATAASVNMTDGLAVSGVNTD
jgi:hypothetical protein